MIVLDGLAENGGLRFTRIGELSDGISQKMLTQTLRQMERDGLVVRTVHPVVPPKVEYRLTDMGVSLAEAFCGVWIWAGEHLEHRDHAGEVRCSEGGGRLDGRSDHNTIRQSPT